MSYEDLQAEVDRLRQELETSNIEKEKLIDEREELINQYEEDFDRRRAELEEQNKAQLESLQASQENQITTLTHQLDQMHRAFSGDPCGWREKTDKRTNKIVYVNDETNETSKEKPMILEFAEKVMSIESVTSDRDKILKAGNKARDAETAKRKMELVVNETRAEIINLKSLLKNWSTSSVEIFHEMNTFDGEMYKIYDKVMQKLPNLERNCVTAKESKEHVNNATSRIETKNNVISAQHFEITALKKENAQLQKEVEMLSNKVETLEQKMDLEVEAVSAPLRLEIASSYALLMKEKAARTEDRIELADLWPPGWLMPTVLMKYKTMNTEDKKIKRQQALEMDAERALKEEIRNKVLEASKWSAQYDDYGQTFYQHADTGQSEWEQPEAMLYTPPPGRDEMGNKLLVQKEKPDGDNANDQEESVNEIWEEAADEWGQTYYTNKKTGETSWEAPPGFVSDPAAMLIDPKDSAKDAARIVISYLRNREPETLDDGTEEELVYDLEEIETLAAGEDNWKYKPPGEEEKEEEEDEKPKGKFAKENSKEIPLSDDKTLEDLREMVYDVATEENKLENNLRDIRHKLSKLSHRLLEKKRTEDKEEEAELLKINKEKERLAIMLKQKAEREKREAKSDLEFIKAEVDSVKKQQQENSANNYDNDNNEKAETNSSSAAASSANPQAEEEALQSPSPPSPTISSLQSQSNIPAEWAAMAQQAAEEPPSPENTHPEESLEARIEALKLEHEDFIADDFNIKELIENAPPLSIEVEQMLANNAAPKSAAANLTVQSLAIQAVWGGYTNQKVQLPPLNTLKGDDENTKWGTACFFASLGTDDLPTERENFSDSDDENDDEYGEDMLLPGSLAARENRLRDVTQGKRSKNDFLRKAAEVANSEMEIELNRATDASFGSPVDDKTSAKVDNQTDDYVKSSINSTWNQHPIAVGSKKPPTVDQLVDPDPDSRNFNDKKKNEERIAAQDESRKEIMRSIMEQDKLEMDSPWLVTQKSSPTKTVEPPREADTNTVENDYEEEEKKSSSGSQADNIADDELFDEKFGDETNPDIVQSLSRKLSLSSASEKNTHAASLSVSTTKTEKFEEIDAVAMIVEEAIIHDKKIRPLLNEAEKYSRAVWSDHEEISKHWQTSIDESTEAVKTISKKLQEQQGIIASMEGELKGLGIAISKPKPPQLPPPVKKVGAPRGVKVVSGDEIAEAESDPTITLLADRNFDALCRDIINNKFNGKQVTLPDDASAITETQNEKLNGTINNKNETMQSDFDTQTSLHADKLAKFSESLEDWETRENERLEQYNSVRYKLRLLNLKVDAMSEQRQATDDEILRFKEELAIEKERGVKLAEVDGRCETVRCKQVMEQFRGPEMIAFLQDQLSVCINQRNRAMGLPDAAITPIQKCQLEEKKNKILKQLRITIARIREQLIEEGRRRRYLYEEELYTSQKDLKRIREENAQAIERGNALRVISQLTKLKNDAIQAASEAKVAEAMLDKDGVDVAGSDGEIYAEDKVWSSPRVNQCLRDLVDIKRCLGAALEARSLGRMREARLRVSTIEGNASTVPPHADLWLPQMERQRMIEESEWLKMKAKAAMNQSKAEILNEKLVANSLKGAIEVLQSKIESSENTRINDVTAIKGQAYDSFLLLQRTLKESTVAWKTKEERFEEAISELSKEFNVMKNSLEAEIAVLNKDLKTSQAMSVTLRYDLGGYQVREEVNRKALSDIKEIWRKEVDSLKVQLRSERNHTARLELWIAAMHDDVKFYLKEIKLREQWLTEQRKQSEAAKLELKYEKWKQTTAIYSLGTDVDALFLFFCQRLVNLAGSRRHYNDALRANGAMQVLAALCNGPRKELRRLAARALGSMGWNGFVEQRLLGWDVVRSWKLWCGFIIPREEERLKKIGRTFEDKVETVEEGEDGVGRDGEVFKPSGSLSLRAIIRERRQWALRKARRREGPNEANQLALGQEKNVLKLLLNLCRDKEWDVVRYATLALSVAAYHENNNETMGRTKHCVETVVNLCRNSDEEIQTQAAATLANLGYACQKNQELIGACGGVDALVDLLQGGDVDVIEAATAALANIITLHSGNGVRLAQAGGVDILSHLITSNQIVNLLDFDQISEIQANAAECLANVTRNYGRANAARIHELGITPLVLMCGSKNLQVQRHSALVIGNIAQDEEQREKIGLRGGVEALFLLCEASDEAVQANSLWALSNLGWHPLNQERIGRYLEQVLTLCESKYLPVQTNAVCCLANALYFHDKNRERLREVDGGLEMIVKMCTEDFCEPIIENALRAVVSLTYVDNISVPLGKDGGLLPILVKRCLSTAPLIQKYAAMALLNLSVHDVLKIMILNEGGVEALAGMQGSESEDARKIALEVLEELADIKNIDSLAEQKAAFGVAGMLQLCQTDNKLIKKLACESIAEEVWSNVGKQDDIRSLGGCKVLIEIVGAKEVDDEVLLPALWAVRNCAHGNALNKKEFGNLSGVKVLVGVCEGCKVGGRDSILESALTCLVNLVVDDEQNCRNLLKFGLDSLIDIAEDYAGGEGPNEGGNVPEISEGSIQGEEKKAGEEKMSKSNSALATSLLVMLGPYNYLVCGNCGKEQPGGTSCESCGHAISFAVSEFS